MLPSLYAACVDDLVHHSSVTVECLDCRRRTEVAVEVLRARLPA